MTNFTLIIFAKNALASRFEYFRGEGVRFELFHCEIFHCDYLPSERMILRTATAKGKVSVVKQLKARAEGAGCRVKGKVRLPGKPAKKAKTKVTVAGKKLRTKHLVAVRL